MHHDHKQATCAPFGCIKLFTYFIRCTVVKFLSYIFLSDNTNRGCVCRKCVDVYVDHRIKLCVLGRCERYSTNENSCLEGNVCEYYNMNEFLLIFKNLDLKLKF